METTFTGKDDDTQLNIGQFNRWRTAYNRIVYASPPFGGSGYAKHQSGLRPLWCFAPLHFFAPVKMLRIFPYRAQKKVIYNRNVRRNTPQMVDKIFKNILTLKNVEYKVRRRCYGNAKKSL